MIHWTALFLFLILALLGLWVAYSFLNKNGFFLFSIITTLISLSLPFVSMFSLQITISCALLPLVFFSILICDEKYGRDDSKRLTFYLLISMLVYIVVYFFLAAYMDAEVQSQVYLTWEFLSPFVSTMIAFAVAVLVANLICSKVKDLENKKYLRRSAVVSLTSFIYLVIFNMLAFAGLLSIGSILLCILTTFVISVGASFAVCYLAKFLNRKPTNPIEDVPDKEE